MYFGTQASVRNMNEVNVSLGGEVIEEVSTFNYLWMKLDNCLTFNDHINYISGKTFVKIKLLGKLGKILDRGTLQLVYKTLIRPVIEYGDIVYHGVSNKNADILQPLQNTVCRAILRTNMYAHIDDMHCQINM